MMWNKVIPIIANLDKIFAIIGIAISLPMIVFGGRYARSAFLILGILTLCSCVIWLLIRSNIQVQLNPPATRSGFLFWSICFFVLYIISVISIYCRPHFYERPLVYFVSTALMAGVIACQVLCARRRYDTFILIQIILLGVSIGWSLLLIVPDVIGKDPWFHMGFTNLIISEGYIPQGSMYKSYEHLPLFHLVIAVMSMVTGFSFKYAAIASVSIGQIVSNSLCIYLIAKSLFSNKIGLLSALFMVTACYHVLMSCLFIPNAFGVVYIVLLLYLILIKLGDASSTAVKILTVILMGTIILTHSIVSIIMAIFLLSIWALGTIHRKIEGRFSFNLKLIVPVGFTLSTLAWWIYSSGHIIKLTEYLVEGFNIERKWPELVNYKATVPFTEALFDLLPLYAFLTLSLIGVLYMISKKENGLVSLMAVIAILPILIAFMFNISGQSVIEQRWFYIGQILLSIPLALTSCILGQISKKYNNYYLIIFGLVVTLSLLTFLGNFGSMDYNAFTPNSTEKLYYTDSEMLGSSFVNEKLIGPISSDLTYCINPSSSIFMHVHQVDPERLTLLEMSFYTGIFNHDKSSKVIRAGYIEELQRKKILSSYILPDINVYLSNMGFNKVYDNSALTIHTE